MTDAIENADAVENADAAGEALDEVEVEEAPPPKDAELKSVAELAARQVKLEAEIAELEAQVTAKKNELKIVSEVDLPNAILKIGLTAVPLKDGTVIEIVTKHTASIPAARRDEAFAWLKVRGDDDIIKRIVMVQFGRGEETEALLTENYMRESYPQLKVVNAPSIHEKTLGAYVRRMLAAGVDIPHDVFGIYTRRFSKITKKGSPSGAKSTTESDQEAF